MDNSLLKYKITNNKINYKVTKAKQKYMNVALKLAKKAFLNGDIPIGAVVVDASGKIIGKGYNAKEKKQNPVYHAEVIAIKKAAIYKKSWRLNDCQIFTTLEPCLMCLGAIIQARINKVVFALQSEKFGSINLLSSLNNNIQSIKRQNYSVLYSYEYEPTSEFMLKTFFANLRN